MWEKIRQFSPEVKVLTTQRIKDQLQNPEKYTSRVVKTFRSSFIGEMKPLPEEAYEIINPEENIEIPSLKSSQRFQLVATPGHSPDHLSPTLFENGTTKFIFNAEASGSKIHSENFVTLPGNMPEYNVTEYTKSLEKIIDLRPLNIGYGHFGAVIGQNNVEIILHGHHKFIFDFRNFVKEKFVEGNGKTRFIVEKFLKNEFEKRSGIKIWEAPNIWVNTIVALVYGQFIDLGLKKPK